MQVTRLPGRTRVSTGAEWEPVVGYSRAVRIDRHIAVTATIGLDPDGRVARGGMYAQARRALEIVIEAVEALGATRENIIRTRMFVTDIDQWADAGRAHREMLGEVAPATTLVQVARLITPEALIEIEADAIVRADG